MTIDEVKEMYKGKYQDSILANTCTTLEDYGYEDKGKILVIKIRKNMQ